MTGRYSAAWALGCALSSLGALASEDDSLRPIAQCIAGGSLKSGEPQRLPDSVRSRSVALPGGAKPVSVADGYRLMLATAQGLNFVNLKLERSAPDRAAADREVLREQMRAFEAQRIAGAQALRDESQHGVQLLGLDQPGIEGYGALGYYTLFEPTRALVITAVFLNQEPARRAFQNPADYAKLRDGFLSELHHCLKP